ncbi:hypothetical protein BGX34_002181 [Mortierella sp. NVP85]|nr:hypothetical protein BGX34_002181 [Mortierella sp. NVP85]
MGNLQRNMDEDKSSADPGLPDDDKDYIEYEDPTVDTIMNGYDDDEEEESGYESDWTHPLDNEVDGDESLRQEIELLNAIERSKIWSPFPSSNTSRNLLSRNAL